MKNTTVPGKIFRGLNSVADPLQLGLEWQRVADNCEISNRYKLARARGFIRRTTNTRTRGAYATDDLQRLYLVDDTELLRVLPDMTTVSLATGLAPLPMRFTEVAGVVYGCNGVDFLRVDNQGVKPWGVPTPDVPVLDLGGSGVLASGEYAVCCTFVDPDALEGGSGDPAVLAVPDGRSLHISVPQLAGYTTNVYVTKRNLGRPYFLLQEAAGASLSYNCDPDALNEELDTWSLAPPRGQIPALFQGAMFLAEYVPSSDQSIVWRSEDFLYHLFDYSAEGFLVPGEVRVLAAADEHLIVGTDREIYAFDGEAPELVAAYGVVPGVHASRSNKQLYLWTLRGLARAMPFTNLTESTLSVAPGTSAAGAVIEHAGNRRYVAALHQGGIAYNPRP